MFIIPSCKGKISPKSWIIDDTYIHRCRKSKGELFGQGPRIGDCGHVMGVKHHLYSSMQSFFIIIPPLSNTNWTYIFLSIFDVDLTFGGDRKLLVVFLFKWTLEIFSVPASNCMKRVRKQQRSKRNKTNDWKTCLPICRSRKTMNLCFAWNGAFCLRNRLGYL